MTPPNAVKEVQLVPRDEPQAVATVDLFERLARDPGMDVDKLDRLMQLYERASARRAEEQFNAAMAAAQKQMKPVATDAENSQTHSRYASYEALDGALRPIYTDRGFALSFNTADCPTPEWVRIVCDVTHIGGHAKTYRADMPADGKGAKGGDVMTKTHAVGSAMSYGMRYLLKMIFNVAVGEGDDDGNRASGTVVPDPPAGFEKWWIEMADVVPEGLARYHQLWKESDAAFRVYVSTYRATEHEARKLRAKAVRA